jgi:uncharacterized protein (TIGR02271 family)
MNTNQTAEDLFGYDVMDSSGSKIGSVDGVWVDDATNDLEFVAVKTGMLFGKNHIIPLQDAQVDNGSQSIQLPYPADQVKDAPSFDTNAQLSPDDEQQVYNYYGMQRTTGPSPSGLGTDGGTGTETGYTGTQTGYTQGTDTGDQNITLSEEEMAVGKRQVEAGQARLRKVVRTTPVTEQVDLRRENVEIERVPASGQVPDTAFQEQEINVPVMKEEPVVSKEARVTGGVQVRKDSEIETRTVEGQVRKEDVEVDDDTDDSNFDDTTVTGNTPY